jgi:hypothetical protein
MQGTAPLTDAAVELAFGHVSGDVGRARVVPHAFTLWHLAQVLPVSGGCFPEIYLLLPLRQLVTVRFPSHFLLESSSGS